jgi:hypothetical protein
MSRNRLLTSWILILCAQDTMFYENNDTHVKIAKKYGIHELFFKYTWSSGAVTAYPSRAPEFTAGFKWGSCYLIFRFMCMFLENRCLFFCPFSFGHCVVCPSIYGFWLQLWYLQTLIMIIIHLRSQKWIHHIFLTCKTLKIWFM